MQLPHAVLQTSFTGVQGICEYQGNFQSTMSNLGLDSNSIPNPGAYSFTNTQLYAQSGCCSGSCCGCSSSCGGELGNTVNVGVTGRQGEIDTMLARLATDGNAQSSNAPCGCYCKYSSRILSPSLPHLLIQVTLCSRPRQRLSLPRFRQHSMSCTTAARLEHSSEWLGRYYLRTFHRRLWPIFAQWRRRGVHRVPDLRATGNKLRKRNCRDSAQLTGK